MLRHSTRLALYAACVTRMLALESTAERGSTLKELWKNSKGPIVDRWDGYAPVYERYFPKPANVVGTLKMLEIGIMYGGSAYTWRQYYGDKLYYVGADITEKTKAFENPGEDLYIETGSQLNRTFLEYICAKHGPFDIIIDDGGHTAAMIRTTLETMFPSDRCMAPSYSIFAVEDTHTMMRGAEGRDMFFTQTGAKAIYELAGEAFWAQHYLWAGRKGSRSERNPYGPGVLVHPIFKDKLQAMHTYDSIMILERGPTAMLGRIVSRGARGSSEDPYKQIVTGIPAKPKPKAPSEGPSKSGWFGR